MNEFEQLALDTAVASPCKKRKVGAVLTDGELIFKGVNHERTSHCCEDEQGNTKDTVVHAEIAALGELKRWLCTEDKISIICKDWSLYVTHQPCVKCRKAIAELEEQYPIYIIIKVVEEFMKFDADKLRYDLIPPSAMKALAEVLTYGAKKYKPNNWRNGDKDRYIAALYRHLEAWRAGEQKDEESGMVHLAHALTNVAFLLELDSSTSKELNNGNK